jgi:hypothetical protein
VIPIPFPLLKMADAPPLLAAGGGAFLPTNGNLFITALDCDGKPATGVTFGIDRDQATATPLYIDNGVVSNTVSQTDGSGLGGFAGVPAGFVKVFGEVEIQPGIKSRIGEIGVQVQPFSITKTTLGPQ